MTATTKIHLALTAGLFLFSIIWVAAGLPLSPQGAWEEIYSAEPAWIMALWMVGPGIGLIGLAAACTKRREKPSRLLQAGAPFLLAALSFWSLKSATQLRQAGPASNYFYFTAAIGPGGFVGQAMKADRAGEYLRDFPAIASRHWSEFGGTRVVSNPPGTTLLIYGCRRMLEASPALLRHYASDVAGEEPPSGDDAGESARARLLRALALFVPEVFLLLIALGMLPLWWLAHEFLPASQAPIASVTAALVPSLFVFSFAKDGFQVSIALWFWWSLCRTVKRGSPGFGVLTGLLLFLGLQFSLAFLVVAVVGFASLGLSALTASGQRGDLDDGREEADGRSASATHGAKLRPRRLGTLGAGLVGCCLPALLLWLTVGYEAWSAMLTAFRGHQQYHQNFGQRYGIWVWLNLLQLFLFMGAPAAASWLVAGFRECRGLIGGSGFRNIDPFFWGATGVLLLLNFSGKNLGEVPRLWLFFMPALYLASERVLSGERDRPAWTGILFAVLQLVQVSVFTIRFDPLGASARALTNLYQGLQ